MSAALCTWDASPTQPVDGYNIYLEKDGVVTKVNSSLITDLEYKITNLSPGTYSVSYDTAVRGERESEPSNIASFTIEFDTRYKPSGLDSTVDGSDVTLEWDYVPGIQAYNVYVDDVKQNSSLIYSNSFEITGLSSATYDWYVASVYDGDEVNSDTEEFTI